MSEHAGSWQPDPFGRNQYRYWDGTQWTDQVSNDGVVGTDPAVARITPAGSPEAPPVAAGARGGSPAVVSSDGGKNKTPLIVGIALVALLLGVGAYFMFFSGDDDDEVSSDRISASGLGGLPGGGSSTDLENFDFDFGDGAEGGFGFDFGGDAMNGMAVPPAMIEMLAREIAADSEISENQARCLVEQLFSASAEGFEGLLAGGGDIDSFEMQDSGLQIYRECGIDPSMLYAGGLD